MQASADLNRRDHASSEGNQTVPGCGCDHSSNRYGLHLHRHHGLSVDARRSNVTDQRDFIAWVDTYLKADPSQSYQYCGIERSHGRTLSVILLAASIRTLQVPFGTPRFAAAKAANSYRCLL
jgi:hypothetical protein